MAIEIYRSSDPNTDYCWDLDEICRECAEKKISENHYVEYDFYKSEREKDCEKNNCQECEGTLFIDGRKKWERLSGAVY